MQKAMPTTVSTWLDSYNCALKDQLVFLNSIITLFDQNPLGSASGFGFSNFFLDRELTTEII